MWHRRGWEAGFGEDVEAEVAALFGPFVVLLGQDGTDQPDQRGPVGEDPDDIGAAPDLPVQPFLGIVGPDLPPRCFRERGERQNVDPGLIKTVGEVWQLVGQGVKDAVELPVHRVGVGLVIDRVQQRLDPTPGVLRG